jgi:hypothetical protein
MTWLLILLAQTAQALSIGDVSALTVSAPQLVCELDLSVLKGDVRRLSWSPDGSYLHLQTVDRDVLATISSRSARKSSAWRSGSPNGRPDTGR